MTDIAAIIPVRAGSVRIANKGLRPFGGTSLLELKISFLKKIKNLSRIVVSSDCPVALQIASNLSVETHKREDYYASSKCTGSEFFKNLAESIDSEILVYTPPTSPFITPETIEESISSYFKENCDSVATVHPVKHHMWLNEKPLNYDLQNSPNSQDLPEILRITYGVCVNSRENVIKNRNFVGINPFFVKTSEKESIDIDNMIDFNFAEFLFLKDEQNV
tara:strand:+ start:19792 stop:20451 length:660 start_codon:yes stop_codon:yes gene_type:complete